MVTISIKPWREFRAEKQPAIVRKWLDKIGENGVKRFQKGMTGRHSGRKYPNLPNRSSAPGEYPATQSGALLKSIKSKTKLNNAKLGNLNGDVTIGSNRFYSLYLRQGTAKMRRRKMSDDALKETPDPGLRGWVKWTRTGR